MKPGTVIILNGASSSGKSSILRAFQDLMPEPFMDMGIDRFIWMMPARYLERPLWDDVLGEASRAGETGRRLVSTMHHAIATAAGLGNDIIVDHVLVEEEWVNECAALFKGISAYLVGVYCPLEVLEQREQQRKNRTLGQARAQFEIVHKYCIYDITVDTSRDPAAQCAAQIAARLQEPPRALEQLGRKSSMI